MPPIMVPTAPSSHRTPANTIRDGAGFSVQAADAVEAQTERELEIELARLRATPVWTAGSVRRFLGAWPRKTGRPSASTRQQAG